MPAITPEVLPPPLADKTWTAHKLPQLVATPYVYHIRFRRRGYFRCQLNNMGQRHGEAFFGEIAEEEKECLLSTL
jgi:hypothetical protein